MDKFAARCVSLGLTGLCAALVACSDGGRRAEVTEPPATSVPQPTPTSGSVTGKVPVAAGGLPVVVLLEPRDTGGASPQISPPVMDQRNLMFIPNVLVVRTGQPAEFLNSDDELHNLNVKDSDTRQQAFNVAIPTDGKYVHTLDHDGIYDVSCDIHPGMSAQIFAVSTPYSTLTDASGQFAFSEVPPGQYLARAFATPRVLERTIEVATGPVELDFTNH